MVDGHAVRFEDRADRLACEATRRAVDVNRTRARGDAAAVQNDRVVHDCADASHADHVFDLT